MRRMLVSTAAVALALAAGTASAAEWRGTIEQINEVRRTITVSDETRPGHQEVFSVSDMNTVGATIDDLREGDQVSIFYATRGAPTATSSPTINAMRITKIGEAADAAQMGDTAEWRGTVDRVDGTARMVTVDGQDFVIGDVHGVTLDELQPGDQVVVVYDHTGEDPEVVEITRIQ